MNTETDYLKTIAEEIADQNSPDPSKPNNHLQVEARLEKAIIHSLNSIENFTQRDAFHFNTLSKLVNICDLLFEITNSVNPDVLVIIDLLTAVKQIIPDEIRPNLKLPKAFIEMQRASIAAQGLSYSSILQQQGIGGNLIDIAGIPFKRFIGTQHKLYWGDFTWLKGYQAKLDIVDWANADCSGPAEALMSLLIGRDFNDDRFYIYCKKYIQNRLSAISGKRNKLLELAQCEKLVLEDTQIGTASFDSRANSVSTRLLKWIKEEIDFVETHEREVTHAKLHFHMYVNRIAFFFKLLAEQKVFGDTSFKELAQQIASSCLAIDGEEILATTSFPKPIPRIRRCWRKWKHYWSGC
ncbi:hypothetical protein [Mucilaginibacter sp.]|uniref:hypothetical protein n=1 Tax=Mucilaginibacter sp. TaxID=1882438 RepID=UPI003D13DB0F